jgi:hypothetical protein
MLDDHSKESHDAKNQYSKEKIHDHITMVDFVNDTTRQINIIDKKDVSPEGIIKWMQNNSQLGSDLLWIPGHLLELSKLSYQNILKTSKESSTLVKHFSQQSHWPNLPPNKARTPYPIWQKLNFEILYQCSPMTVVRHFGMVNCPICMHKKLEILRHSFDPDVNLINS